jgi:hypothetical protein
VKGGGVGWRWSEVRTSGSKWECNLCKRECEGE